MKTNVKIAIIAFLIVIAINITVVMIAFAGQSSGNTPSQEQGAIIPSTPTTQPGTTPSSDTTPTATIFPTVTTMPVPTGSPAPTSAPTQTATPTATQTGATPTSQPTSTPSGGGGGGGTQPTPTPTPTQTQTPTTIVSVSAASQVQRGNTFTIDINITQVNYLALAGFDVSFDADILALEGVTEVNWGNEFNPTQVFYQTMEPGLIRVVWDNINWANNVNNGYGASGSGALCRITFTAAAAGTSQLAFVQGHSQPEGELKLIRWMAWVDSTIPNVGWNGGSITVVN